MGGLCCNSIGHPALADGYHHSMLCTSGKCRLGLNSGLYTTFYFIINYKLYTSCAYDTT